MIVIALVNNHQSLQDILVTDQLIAVHLQQLVLTPLMENVLVNVKDHHNKQDILVTDQPIVVQLLLL